MNTTEHPKQNPSRARWTTLLTDDEISATEIVDDAPPRSQRVRAASSHSDADEPPNGAGNGTEHTACKPHIQLPGRNRLISDFATELAEILMRQPVFTRHNEVVTIDDTGKKLRAVPPEMLRTLVEQYCAGFERHWENKRPVNVYVTMSVDVARAVVVAPQLHQTLRKVRHVHHCRQPVLRQSGDIELLPSGYDAESEILTLDGGLEYPTNTPLNVNGTRKVRRVALEK